MLRSIYALGHELCRIVRLSVVHGLHFYGKLRVTHVALSSSRYGLKCYEYRCEKCDGRQADSDGHGRGRGDGQRGGIVIFGGLAEDLVPFGHRGVPRRYSSLASRRTVPAATGFWVTEATFFGLRTFLQPRTAGHALIVQFVQVQRRRTSRATEFAGSGTPAAIRVTTFAELSQRIVILCTETLHAKTTL